MYCEYLPFHMNGSRAVQAFRTNDRFSSYRARVSMGGMPALMLASYGSPTGNPVINHRPADKLSSHANSSATRSGSRLFPRLRPTT